MREKKPPDLAATLLTPAAAAALLGVSEATVRREIADGAIKASRVRSLVRVHKDDLAEYQRAIRVTVAPIPGGGDSGAAAGALTRLSLAKAGWDGDDHDVGRRGRRKGG